eukprot:TRINITY_DN2062_c0_g1_i1.p1 TRINITY_DN2062_c0_g1~~TRINITY_DN2062_c0_g1_i1.p1  ORF type:complete len:307 (+),score=84.06 TRINITY_DN2062_c0_g1_i1:61-981(+)
MGNSVDKINNFNGSTTAEEVAGDINLKGKNALVTGANTGIGKETARVLAKQGATVFLACRDREKCQAVEEEIKRTTQNQEVYSLSLDLGDLASVRACAQEFNSKNLPLHLLINNAGMVAGNLRTVTKDGFEATMGVNHFGPFLFTNLLLDRIKEAAPSRIVVVSSEAHRRGIINFNDINWEQSYSIFSAYAQSKLANVLFANELSKRLEGSGVTVNSLHPGVVKTDLGRNSWISSLFFTVGSVFMKNTEQGAATSVFLAVSPQVEKTTATYFADCNPYPVAEVANDKQAQVTLWELSEKFVGLVPQ